MSRLPRIEARRLLTALRKHGFAQVGQSGSHIKLRHPDGRVVVVPLHSGRMLKPGLLHRILEVANIDRDEV